MSKEEEPKNFEIKKAPEELTEQELKKMAGGSDWEDPPTCRRDCNTH